jgi:hypothetical protein
MGKLPVVLLSAVVSLVFGFLGSFVAVSVFSEELRGPQGATGLTGAPGQDGEDGAPGEQGPPGPAGRAGRTAKVPELSQDLGTSECAGTSVQVVTDAQVVRQRLRLTKVPVCITE